MAPINPTTFGAASKLAPRAASSLTGDLKDLQSPADPHPQPAFVGAATTPRSGPRAVRDASAELGYGCVDWFIYATDAADAADAMRQAAA